MCVMKNTKFVSKESTFALRSTTEALYFFVFDRAHFIVVVPRQLLHGFDTSMEGEGGVWGDIGNCV